MLRSEKGQAVIELALVVFLFFIFLSGVTQLVMLGSAHVQCQLAVRRAAWLWNNSNNASYNKDQKFAQIQALLPGTTDKPIKISGTRETGMTFEIRHHIAALGMFRMFRPTGFTISARSAVIAYNPAPKAAEGVDKLWKWVNEQLR